MKHKDQSYMNDQNAKQEQAAREDDLRRQRAGAQLHAAHQVNITPASTPADAPTDALAQIVAVLEEAEVDGEGTPTTNASIPLADATGEAAEIAKVDAVAFLPLSATQGLKHTGACAVVDADFAREQARTIATLTAELAEARKGKWLPIDEAPKTGEDMRSVEILGWIPDEADIYDGGDRDVVYWEPLEKKWFCRGVEVPTPTHWQLLPEPPDAAR